MTVCGTSCVEGVTAFPPDAIPLFTVAVSNGVFQHGSLTDMRSRYRAPKRAIAGPNIVLTETTDSVIYTVPSGPLRNQPSGVQPACSATTRGTFWHVNGASGAKDTVTVCAKDASDTYSWRMIY
jgi:hypothetical protein